MQPSDRNGAGGLLLGLWLRGRVEQRAAPATEEPVRRRLADTAARDA